MKTLLIIVVLLFSIGTALSAAKDSLDSYKVLVNNRHAQIEALTSNKPSGRPFPPGQWSPLFFSI